jgi:hypothetical protein
MTTNRFSILFVFTVITILLFHGVVSTVYAGKNIVFSVELLEENLEEEENETKSGKDLTELLKMGNKPFYEVLFFRSESRLTETDITNLSTIFSFNFREIHSPPPEC